MSITFLQVTLAVETVVAVGGFTAAYFTRHAANYAPADMSDLPLNVLGLVGAVALVVTLIIAGIAKTVL